jgi:hypothetical protein
VIQACLSRQLLVLADRAHRGAGATVHTPTTAETFPRSTPSSTGTTPDCGRRANAPSRASSNGGSSAKPAAAPTASATRSPPFTPSRSPGTQDEKRSVTGHHFPPVATRASRRRLPLRTRGGRTCSTAGGWYKEAPPTVVTPRNPCPIRSFPGGIEPSRNRGGDRIGHRPARRGTC